MGFCWISEKNVRFREIHPTAAPPVLPGGAHRMRRIIMKVGIIRCAQTEDYCPGTTDFRMIREKKGVFEGVEEDIELIGFINCGGCPGKKAVLRARELVRRGADTIVFASCINKGTPIGFPCPNAAKMLECIRRDLGDKVRYLSYTH